MNEPAHRRQELQELVNRFIASLDFERDPLGLYEPIRYALGQGGKRLRPVLVLMAYDLFADPTTTEAGQYADEVLYPAVGMEVFHNYTLLHDDLMDKADKRRGQPTVHKKWGDNTAILSGDAMLVLAYEIMRRCPKDKLARVLRLFGNTAIGVCEGQQYDMEFERRHDVTEAEYMEMILLKTSVLLAGCTKLGALLANAPKADADRLYDFGINIGLAFQLQDDLLDVYGDTSVFGKNIGGDILCNKKTYLLIKALQHANAEQRAELEHWLSLTEFDPQEKVEAVTYIYNGIGVRALCEERIAAHTRQAQIGIDAVRVPAERKQPLQQLMNDLVHRQA